MPNEQIRTSHDVIAFLLDQHQQIEAAFQAVGNARGEAREEAFLNLRRLLAVHETAEEQIVHPRARVELARGEAVVTARLREEHDAKEALAELEKLDVNSHDFDAGFAKLREAVLAHAEHEEAEEFPQLAEAVDEQHLEAMARAAELVERFGPTRPHPGIETGTENTLLGPFVSMLDRARDYISGAQHARASSAD